MPDAVMRALLSGLVAAAMGCSPDSAHETSPLEAPSCGVELDTASSGAELSTTLQTPETLSALSPESGEVKFVLPIPDAEPFADLGASCYFQDMTQFPMHLDFLRSRPGWSDLTWDAYTSLVLDSQRRVLWAGAVSEWPFTVHPNGEQGVVAYTLATDPEATLSGMGLTEIIAVQRLLEICVPWAADKLVFVPTDDNTASLVAMLPETLHEAGVTVLMAGALGPGLTSKSYVQGQSFGYLRLLDANDDVSALKWDDVVIAPMSPPDLPWVAGLVTGGGAESA